MRAETHGGCANAELARGAVRLALQVWLVISLKTPPPPRCMHEISSSAEPPRQTSFGRKVYVHIKVTKRDVEYNKLLSFTSSLQAAALRPCSNMETLISCCCR